MKIIKVIHQVDPSKNQEEQEYFVLRNYKIHNYLNNNIDVFIKEFDNTEDKLRNILYTIKNKENTDNNFIKFLPKVTNWSKAIPFIGTELVLLEELFKYMSKDEFNTRKKSVIIDFMDKIFLSFIEEVTEKMKQVEIFSLKQAKVTFPKTRNLSIGTYTLHPRDSQMLTRLEYFHKNLAMEKDDELIVLLGRMGAKSLRIIEGDISQNLGKVNVNTNTVKVGGAIDIDVSKKLEKEKDLLVKFEGNAIDLEQNLLDNSLWFSDDSKLISIYESRKFQPNKIESYTLRNTYTETFDFDFDLAANFLVVKTDLKAQYQSVSKKERLFEIEFGS